MVSVEEQAVISDIIGVAGAGFRLSLILNAVSCEVEGEGLEVHNISKTVTLFALTLKNVGISLQSPDSVHTTEALDGVNRISEDAMEVFDHFNDMLDRVRTKPAEGGPQPSIQQRFQWCFKKQRVSYLLAQLDSLKMDASLFQQILSLGKLMASTNKHDSPDEVALKQELIKQERAEAQNVLIVRYWQRSKVEKLWAASLNDDENKTSTFDSKDNEWALVKSPQATKGSQQLAIEAPPSEYASSLALVKLPTYSLGDLDEKLDGITKSSKDMVQVSSDVLEPLLERWTRWYEVREKRHAREAKNRYVPTVDNLQEDDDDVMHPNRQYNGRNGQNYEDHAPRGYYLEGNTTDWRNPQSYEARQTYTRRKKEYTRYQPSISQDNSDAETNSNGSHSQRGKRAPRRHIIDSESESEPSDHEPQPQAHRTRPRHGSNSPTQERSYPAFPPPQYQQHLNSPRPNPSSPMTSARPYPHHAYTAPGPYPPINIANAHNPYAPSGAQQGYPLQHYKTGPTTTSPSPQQQQQYPTLSTAHARYTPAGGPSATNTNHNGTSNSSRGPPNLQPPSQYNQQGAVRPVSRDGSVATSASRSSYSSKYPAPNSIPIPGAARQSPSTAPLPARDRDGRQIHYDTAPPYRPFVVDEQGRRVKPNLPERDRGSGGKGGTKGGKLAEGATKGLLGAGAIAGFLEALEGLSI